MYTRRNKTVGTKLSGNNARKFSARVLLRFDITSRRRGGALDVTERFQIGYNNDRFEQ